jgi:hypothetical protein
MEMTDGRQSVRRFVGLVVGRGVIVVQFCWLFGGSCCRALGADGIDGWQLLERA